MEDQKDLPKPETDLPLPEKELTSGEETTQPIVRNENSPKEGHHLIRTFLFGFLFVVILAALGGAYFLGMNKSKSISKQVVQTQIQSPTPTANPTADWKTYKSIDGYALKYPSTWTVDNSNISKGFVNLNSNEEFPTAPGDPEATTYWISLQKYNNPTNKTLKDLATADLAQNLKNSFTYTTETIDGQVAYRTTSLPSESGCEWVFIKNPNSADYQNLTFCLYDKDKPFENQEKFHNTFNQILSTLKFTDATSSTTDTSDWKTFGGGKYGYSFKYPSDWTQNNNSSVSMPADPACPHCAPGPGSIEVKYYNNPSSLSVSDYLKANSDSFGSSYYIKNFKPFSIPGVRDAMLDPTSLGAYDTQEEALINTGTSVISISCTSSVCTDNGNFEKILATLKLTQ